MYPRLRSFIVALALPAALLVSGILVLGPSHSTVLGMPAVLVFMFCMFPLTSALMAYSWHRWDRHADYEDEASEGARP